jgi:hypothetical protein
MSLNAKITLEEIENFIQILLFSYYGFFFCIFFLLGYFVEKTL